MYYVYLRPQSLYYTMRLRIQVLTAIASQIMSEEGGGSSGDLQPQERTLAEAFHEASDSEIKQWQKDMEVRCRASAQVLCMSKFSSSSIEVVYVRLENTVRQ